MKPSPRLDASDTVDTARGRRVARPSAVAKSLAAREGGPIALSTLIGREGGTPVVGRKEVLGEKRTAVDRVMAQMREANERLIVAAVHAENMSDEAHLRAAKATADVGRLMSELQDAHEDLAAAATQAEAMADEAQQREDAYRELYNRLITLQDEERRSLAVDLHESTGQLLAALTMNLDVVDGAALALDARSHRALAEGRSLAEQCARSVRTLAYLLHPPLLDEAGLASAVRWYAEGFTNRSGIDVHMDLDEVGRMPVAIETALFRVVQESLTNVHRHASTSTASIRLSIDAAAVVLVIHDKGHGLRHPSARLHGARPSATVGVGIQGMRERVRQLGGTFDVDFTDTGTTVRVSVPLYPDTP
jgi:signal transduction histidine kinase